MKTPVGELGFQTDNGKLTSLCWGRGEPNPQVEAELAEYFNGRRTCFKTPIKFNIGTPFQHKVWHALCEIPYGKTVTYADLAEKLGTHPRAIGTAVGKNPIPIIIPCHRVVGKNGSLTGFSGGEGVKTKEILLKLEKAL